MKVQSVTVNVAVLKIPPPPPSGAEFPDKVQPLTVMVPQFKMQPLDMMLLLLERTQSLIVMAPNKLAIAPPCVAKFSVSVSLLTTAYPVAVKLQIAPPL